MREEHDPFTHAYLKAMGRRLGVEVSVNTSLNVGSPIAQSPNQALTAMKQAKALTGLVMFSNEGDAFLAWHNINDGLNDCGRRIQQWHDEWKAARAETN